MCLRELHQKVDSGIEPTKLQEPQSQQDSIDEQGIDFGYLPIKHLIAWRFLILMSFGRNGLEAMELSLA